MSDLANRLWAKGFKPNLGEPWTLADHRRVDELRAEIERREELLEEFQEKSSALLAKSLEQNKEIKRLEAENKRLTERVETLGRCLFSIKREIESVEER